MTLCFFFIHDNFDRKRAPAFPITPCYGLMACMIVGSLTQGTEEWHSARCGVVTASNFKLVLTGGKGKTRATYMRRLAEEIRTGRPTPQAFQSDAMRRGNALEPKARQAYEEHTNQAVREVGIIYLDENHRVGASPDGLVNGDGGLEIKCPMIHTHRKYVFNRTVPTQYVPQVQGNLWVTKREWWDFVSFAPELANDHRMMICRVYRDETYIERLQSEVERFVKELDAML